MIHIFELGVIRWIQQIRTPILDVFFRFLDFFDKPEFFCVLIPAIWLIKGQKTGIKLFYLLLLSGTINSLLKNLLASPRPFHLDPELGLLPISGYGLPSGAAQTVMLLSALLLTHWKSSYRWAIIIPYVSLVSFARIYLGIHFPTDILAGWSVGIAVWACYQYIFPFLERKISTLSPLSCLFLCLVPPLSILIGAPSLKLTYICLSSIGIGLGIYLTHWLFGNVPPASHTIEKIVRAFIGICGTFLCYALSVYSPSAAFFCMGLWVSMGSVWVCKVLQKFQEA